MEDVITKDIIDKIVQEFGEYDTVLVFGSFLEPNWTVNSDIDVFLIDENLSDGRITKKIDNVTIEALTDNAENLRKDVLAEKGNLKNRNLSSMLATARVLKSKSPEKIISLQTLAREILAFPSKYDDSDVEMWRYSIKDYLNKAQKTQEDSVAFYLHANLVIQNSLELFIARVGLFFPQPKKTSELLRKIDPKFLMLLEVFIKKQDYVSLKEFAEYVLQTK